MSIIFSWSWRASSQVGVRETTVYWATYIVAGSYMDTPPLIDPEREQKTLRELLARPGPTMYGRLDWKGRLESFDYLDAARMARFKAAHDRSLAYGTYGGTPRYLVSGRVRSSAL